MATLVMLLGGLLGFALRTTIDARGRTGSRWYPLVVSVAGGFALGALTGAALLGLPRDSPLAAAGIGLSAAVTTFCVFGPATRALVHQGPARRTVLSALGHVVSGFAAATGGVVLGIALVS
ncbi:hypothetical protein GCM10022222_59230 [Amycolatopsis ultiminotia]|uniref:Fluoride ion transporter CrcB n=1 Tax=Amycolatopsis ultiminotia TaxID=543629 RepID=A0ABP6XJW5_9PSEU